MKDSLLHLFCQILIEYGTGPRALVQYAFDLVNLLDIAARCPYVHLLVVEKTICDVEI